MLRNQHLIVTVPMNHSLQKTPDVDHVFGLLEKNALSGTWLLEVDGRHVQFSEGASRLHGLSASKQRLTIEEWRRFYAPEGVAKLDLMLGELAQGSKTAAIEVEVSGGGEGACPGYIHMIGQCHPEQPGVLIGACFERSCCRDFEVRERAPESRLDASDQFWRNAIDSLQIGLWDWDFQSGRVVRTPFWRQLLDDPDEPLDAWSNDWERRIHPDDLPACIEDIQAHFAGHSDVCNLEYRLLNRSGEYVWVQDKSRVIEWDELGQPSRIVGTYLDIGHEMRIRQSLAERERQFQAVFNSMFQFVGMLEPNGRVLECNHAVYEMTGLPQGHMHGIPLWEGSWWKTDQDRRDVKQWVGRASAGEFVRHEVDIVDRDGISHRVDFSVKPVYGASGDIRWLVTEGRHLNPAVSAAAAPAAVSPVEITSDNHGTLLLVDMNCMIISATPAFSELIGYGEEELLRMNFMEITHPDDLGLDQGYVDGMLTGDCDYYSLEKRLVSKQGDVVPVDMEVTVLRRSNGSPLHMLKRIRDLRPAWHEQTLRHINR